MQKYLSQILVLYSLYQTIIQPKARQTAKMLSQIHHRFLHTLEGSRSLSSSKFISRLKLSFTASISSKEQGLSIQRFPRASGSSSKYFLIYEKRKTKTKINYTPFWGLLSSSQ